MGRRCFGLEIDPNYVDTTIRRWQAYTGQQAIHAESGRSFKQLEAEAEEAQIVRTANTKSVTENHQNTPALDRASLVTGVVGPVDRKIIPFSSMRN